MDKPQDETMEEQVANVPDETEKTDQTSGENSETQVIEDAAKELTIEEQLEAEKDKFLRLAAEYDNFRKRSVKERETLYQMSKADTISKLLPVYDNMLRAIGAPCTDEVYYKGIEMMATQMTEILNGLGVEEIPAVGESFNPERHNAVSQVSDESTPSGVITAEFQKGFTIDKKVIRHSMVQVNS